MTVRPIICGTAAAALALGGCGGSGDDAGSKAEPAARETAASDEAAGGADPSPVVAIKGFAYRPAKLTVAEGAEVTWVDRDKANHTVTFDGDAVEDVPNLRNGQRASVRFADPGSYAYVCVYHPSMRGRVVVR